MNRLISLISHSLGLASSSESTWSEATDKNGRSVKRLVSRICLGNMGKKGMNNEAPAILNILPNVAPVVIKIYFMEFTKDFLPS